jgi:hypothetical protein
MAAIVFNTTHPKAQVREQLKTALAALCEMLDAFVSNRMRRAAAEAEQVRTWRMPETQPMRQTLCRTRQYLRRLRASRKVDAPACCRPVRPQPQPRNFGRSIPASSARRFRRSSSAATKKASGLPATPAGGSAEFSCSKAPQCLLRERIAARAGASPFFRPRGSNSTLKTTAIHCCRNFFG